MVDISIIILTYNAPKYVRETIETLNNVTDAQMLKRCEIIVWDNNSNEETKQLLINLKDQGKIQKLQFSKDNLLFAGGNNEASKLASPDSKFYLLLNSDVKIKDRNWLLYLLQNLERGKHAGISYGYCKNPDRCDGYCFLVDRKLYDKYKLDTAYQWWWGVTKLQAQILHEGYTLLAFRHHNHLIYHYGGKSGNAFQNAKGMDTEVDEVMQWFKSTKGKFKAQSALALGNILKYF